MMDKHTPALAAETEALREAYAALKRSDVQEFVKAFDAQVGWSERQTVASS